MYDSMDYSHSKVITLPRRRPRRKCGARVSEKRSRPLRPFRGPADPVADAEASASSHARTRVDGLRERTPIERIVARAYNSCEFPSHLRVRVEVPEAGLRGHRAPRRHRVPSGQRSTAVYFITDAADSPLPTSRARPETRARRSARSACVPVARRRACGRETTRSTSASAMGSGERDLGTDEASRANVSPRLSHHSSAAGAAAAV